MNPPERSSGYDLIVIGAGAAGMATALFAALEGMQVLVREGAKLDFEDCMRLEFRLTNRFAAGHDFYEGVRAVVIDKDQSPKWNPARLADVDPAEVDRYFSPLEDGELNFG